MLKMILSKSATRKGDVGEEVETSAGAGGFTGLDEVRMN